MINLIGTVSGTFTVIGKVSTKKSLHWICRCLCGREVPRTTAAVLKNIPCKKCMVRSQVSKSPEYAAWRSIIGRCEVEGTRDYDRYGGIGITICPEWRNDFQAFLRHIGPKPTPKHTVDRINSKGNYEPGNVRWATQKEQQNNRSDNVWMEYNGETHTLKQWSEIAGIKYITFWWRWNQGWRGDKLLSKPN